MTDAGTPSIGSTTMTPEQVRRRIDAYIDAWNEPDEEKRSQLLAQVMTEDGTYVDPDKGMDDREGVAAYIGDALAKFPGRKIVRTSEVDAHHLMCRFNWRLVKADGSKLPECVDFVEFTADGRIRRVTGFFGLQLPEEQA